MLLSIHKNEQIKYYIYMQYYHKDVIYAFKLAKKTI